MAAQVASQPGITPHVHKARRASMQQIENNFEGACLRGGMVG